MAKFKAPGSYKATGEVGFPVVPAGEYEMRCKKAVAGESKNGNPQVRLECIILSGEPMENGSPTKGLPYSEFITITEKAFTVEKWKNTCNAFGVEVDKNSNAELEDFKGQVAIANVEVRMYNEQEQNQVREWFSPDDK